VAAAVAAVHGDRHDVHTTGEGPSPMIWIIVIVIVVAIVVFGVVGFNRLRSADVGAQEALGGIDVQLTRRADLIPNLVETVKGYAAHEKSVLENVTAARARVQQAASGDDVKAKAEADAALQGALLNLNAVAENYPDLKASQNFRDLQEEVTSTEDRIAYARQFYNDSVRTYNTKIQQFPATILANMFNFEPREFFDAEPGDTEPVQVQF